MKVLVVEDDPNLRALWGAVIERVGHAPDLVETEGEARARLTDASYDLVFLDLCLNGSDGLDTARIARDVNPDCKVVVVTGTSLYPDGEIFALAPAVIAVLRKPVDIEDIMEMCRLVKRGEVGPPPGGLSSGAVEFRP